MRRLPKKKSDLRLIDQIKEKAKKNPQRIVLAEGEEERTLRAAAISLKEGIAMPVLLGKPENLKKVARDSGVNIDNIEIIDPEVSSELERYIYIYISSRGGRHITPKMAERLLKKSIYFGAMMTGVGDAKGMVAGCISLTATVLKASQLMVGMAEGISSASSFFVMSVPDCTYGENGNFIYADAGANINPSAQELAEIAILSARNAQALLGWEPRVAMLSFSTKGSAGHELVNKVIEATNLAKEKAPTLLIDGEFQFDAAIDPEVAKRKVKEESLVAGRANILIFPDLNAGNIGYKMTQYLAKAEAYGPILQGFKAPINDLSRGASVDDILGVMALTTLQAQARVSS